jgi:hypothetical protein
MTGHEKALIAEYFTVGWNVIEGIVAIAAGIVAASIALIGFGLDSYVEVASGIILIWRLRKHGFGDGNACLFLSFSDASRGAWSKCSARVVVG